MRQRSWLGCVVAVVAAAGVLGSPAFGELTVKGDQAAWAEVAAAYKKLYSLSAFRMKIAGEGGMQSVMEFVPPDKTHITSQTPNGAMEVIRVGNQTAFKMAMPGAPATWQCRPLPAQAAGPQDPTTAQGTVEISRGPDTSIDGTPVHTYIYTSTGAGGQSGASTKTTLYVGSQSGLPRRSVLDSGGGHQTTVDYYDYGAAITIVLPACG